LKVVDIVCGKVLCACLYNIKMKITHKIEKIKTTILIDKTLKKLAQVYAIQNDMCLGELIEKSLKSEIMGK
jgi:hypothetical protein